MFKKIKYIEWIVGIFQLTAEYLLYVMLPWSMRLATLLYFPGNLLNFLLSP